MSKCVPASYIHPSLKMASFSLPQIDFLRSLNHVSRTPKPTCVITVSVSQGRGDSSRSQNICTLDVLGSGFFQIPKHLDSPGWSDFCPSRSSAVARGEGHSVRAHCSNVGVRSGHERGAGRRASRCALRLTRQLEAGLADRAV